MMNMIWWEAALNAPAAGAVLALVTTLHCAMAVLLRHRSRAIPAAASVVVPSVGFAASPWLLPAPAWLVAVLGVHVAWLMACERLLLRAQEKSQPSPSRRGPAPPRVEPDERKRGQAAGGSGFTATTVLEVLVETPEIRTFRFARRAGFDFKPGQFVMVRVEVDGRPLVRCYSISSSPSVQGYFEISVRRQGQVSGFLHATVRPGASLEVCGPQGRFVYPEGKRPMLLLAAGIGITPLIGMLRHALESEPGRPVTLVLSARTEQDVPFQRELNLLASRHPAFRLAIALSRGMAGDGYYPGRIDRRLIEMVAADVSESVCLVCGPLPMIDDMVGALSALGVPADRIRFEKFEAATTLATKSAGEVRPADDAGPLCMRLQKRGKVVAVAEGQSILDAVEGAGEELPSFCRAGACGTCKTRVLDGTVEGDFDVIDRDDRAKGFVLACVARPVTNCVIDA